MKIERIDQLKYVKKNKNGSYFLDNIKINKEISIEFLCEMCGNPSNSNCKICPVRSREKLSRTN